MLPALIAAGAQLAGGFLNSRATSEANAASMAWARDQAQHAIRWRVEDAKKAGVHPLFALGASVSSPSPSVIADTSIGDAIGKSGQEISRAMMANQTPDQRLSSTAKIVEGLSLERASLQNELLRSQIRRLEQQANPPTPSPDQQWGIPGQGAAPAVSRSIPEFGPLPAINEQQKQKDRPPLQIGGIRLQTDPMTSNMNEFEDRYGDEGPASWLIPPVIFGRDFMYSFYRAYKSAPPEMQRRMRWSVGDFRK